MQVSSNTQITVNMDKPVDYMTVRPDYFQMNLQAGNDTISLVFNNSQDMEKYFNFMLAAIRRIEIKKQSGESDNTVYVYSSNVTGDSELYDTMRAAVRDAV